MRLINADELKKKLIPIRLYDGVYCKAITEKDIDNAPTVEQELYITGEDYNLYIKGYEQAREDFERPQGQWVNGKDSCAYLLFCSECGMSAQKNTEYPYSFCPFCGADMRGKEE